VKERLQKLGAEPMQMTIPEFTQFVQREVADSQRIIQAAGIKPQ
jgi:tripartite-type tricarboxylate transporter receptor subunit TctC